MISNNAQITIPYTKHSTTGYCSGFLVNLLTSSQGVVGLNINQCFVHYINLRILDVIVHYVSYIFLYKSFSESQFSYVKNFEVDYKLYTIFREIITVNIIDLGLILFNLGLYSCKCRP